MTGEDYWGELEPRDLEPPEEAWDEFVTAWEQLLDGVSDMTDEVDT